MAAKKKKQKKSQRQAPLDIDGMASGKDETPSQKNKVIRRHPKEATYDILTLSKDPDVFKKQAQFLGVDTETLHRMNPNERRVALDIHLRKLFRVANKNPETANETVENQMKDFPGLTKTNSAEIKARLALWRDEPLDEKWDPLPSKEVQTAPDGEEVNVYLEHGDDKIVEKHLRRRDGPTVGAIREIETPPNPVTDLVGDRPPRTLTDLYHRWDVESDSNYMIRIERTKPKKYQGYDVAGLVAEVRNRRITEAEIQQVYGGTEYKITLYGPDPRIIGDENGELKIKALTEPFTLTVPVFPPNINALPGTEQQQMYPNQPAFPMNPFGSRPTSPSDAAIHKTDKEHQKFQEQRQEKRELEIARLTQNMMGLFSKQSEKQLEYEREQARRKEEQYEKKMEEERRAKERQEAAIKEAKEQNNSAVMQLFEKFGPDREGEIRRLVENHQVQLQTVRAAFEDQFKAMRDRHESDLRRSDERLKDVESQYRLLLEQERTGNQKTLDTERQSWSQRERDLRDQAEKDKAVLREQYIQRIDDLKEKHRDEVKTLERNQAQMMTVIQESFNTKIAVSEQTHAMMLQQTQERLEDARSDAERARSEAEEAKDLPKVLERAREQAEAMGYTKADANEPKDWKERLVATLGAGASQFFGSANEWLPGVLEKRQQQQAQMAQLMAAQQAQQAQMQQRARQRQRQQPVQQPQTTAPTAVAGETSRGARWASEGQPPPKRSVSNDLAGFQPESGAPQEKETQQLQPPQPAQSQPIPSEPQTQEQEASAEPLQEQPAEQSESEPENSNGASHDVPIPQKFVDDFTYEGILGFLAQVEQQIAKQVDPGGFADLFVGQYRDYAHKLVTKYSPEEVEEVMKGIEGAEMSPILSREGKKWLQGLWRGISRNFKETQAAQTT